MFSGITSYIFGTSSDDQSVPDNETVLKTTDADNEWVLVDISEQAKSTSEARDEPISYDNDNQAVPLPNIAPDESWFVTPPPCFTAGGHSPVHMEPNPLEDLLIEHPSMSVYGVRPNRTDAEAAESSQAAEGSNQEPREQGVAQRRPRRAAAVAAQLGIEHQQAAYIRSQKHEQKHKQKKLCPGKMHRANKAYQQQSRRQKKRDLISNHSIKICKKRC
ncbi:uncharacterized protein LOC144437486 [Glandiceps talaboti]